MPFSFVLSVCAITYSQQRHEELQLKFQEYNKKLIEYEEKMQKQVDQMDEFDTRRKALLEERRKQQEISALDIAVNEAKEIEITEKLDNPTVATMDEEEEAPPAMAVVEEAPSLDLPPLSMVKKTDLDDLYFQLDEHEDDFHCITEILLRRDGYVDAFETDGPKIKITSGTWQFADAISSHHPPSLTITLHRQFGSGGGDLAFYVARTFTGTLCRVGNRLGVEGTAHELDQVLGNSKVGHFQMADITTMRENNFFKIPPKKGVDSFAFWKTKLVSIR